MKVYTQGNSVIVDPFEDGVIIKRAKGELIFDINVSAAGVPLIYLRDTITNDLIQGKIVGPKPQDLSFPGAFLKDEAGTVKGLTETAAIDYLTTTLA